MALQLELELELLLEVEVELGRSRSRWRCEAPPEGGPRSHPSLPRVPQTCAALSVPGAHVGLLAVLPPPRSRVATAGTRKGWLHRHLPPACGYQTRRTVSYPTSAQPLGWPWHQRPSSRRRPSELAHDDPRLREMKVCVMVRWLFTGTNPCAVARRAAASFIPNGIHPPCIYTPSRTALLVAASQCVWPFLGPAACRGGRHELHGG